MITIRKAADDEGMSWITNFSKSLNKDVIDMISTEIRSQFAHALVRALIHSRLDYCNGLFAGLPAVQFARLQSVLRAAARLVLGLPGRAPVSAVMFDSLHWLSFSQRVTFKLSHDVRYKCLHGLAPTYLSQCCVPVAAVTGRSRLRSADDRMLFREHRLGPLAFSSSGSSSWNSLPPVLRDLDISLYTLQTVAEDFLFNTD